MSEVVGGTLLVVAVISFICCVHRVIARCVRRAPDPALRIEAPVIKFPKRGDAE